MLVKPYHTWYCAVFRRCICHVFDSHLFYLDVCESFLTGKLRVTDHQLTAQIASLIAYVETSDGKRVTGQQVYKDWLSVNTQWHTDCEMTSLISAELMKLNGMSKVGAEYRLIQTVDSLAMYGACYHTARNSAGVSVNIAVTSAGIVFFCENWKQLSRYGNKIRCDIVGCGLCI